MIRKIALIGLLACGCTDPQDPCDRPDACQFPGAHLDLEVALPGSAVTDPADGKPAMAPGDLKIVVSVLNRGDASSDPVHLRAVAAYFRGDTLVPSLQPGRRWQGELRLQEHYTRRVLAGSDTVQAWVVVSSDTISGAESIVDTASTAAFHLLVQAARIDVTPVNDSIVLGHVAPVRLRVTNASRVVPLEAGALHLGLVEGYDFLFPAWPTPAPVPALAAGGVFENVFDLPVPPDAGWLAGALEYHLVACFGTHEALGEVYPDFGTGCGWSAAEYPGVPDLSLCTEATAIPGEVVPAQVTCTGWRNRAYWALDAQEGTRYLADRNITVYTRRGDQLHGSATVREWAAPFTGRVYLVVAFPGPAPELRIDID